MSDQKQITQIFMPGFVPMEEGKPLDGMAFLKKIVPVDGYLTEGHAYSRVVTRYTVESGGSVTDFTKRKPPIITIKAIITDTPVGVWNPLTGLIESYDGRKEDLWQDIKDLDQSDSLLSVNTTEGIYDSYIMEDLSTSKEVEDEESIRFSATFIHLRFAPTVKAAATMNAADSMAGILGKTKNLGRTTPRQLELI